LKRWSCGNARTYAGRPVSDEPLIQIDGSADGSRPPLSFLNLIELRFIASWRERKSLPKIRRILVWTARDLKAERPLLDLDFKRLRHQLFVKYGDELMDADRPGQLVWPEAAETLVESLDYDEDEEAVYRWWPLTRARPVLLDTRVNGGRPTTADSGVRTVAIASLIGEGASLEEITEETTASEDEIRAAAQVEGVELPSAA
jgi:uncharacterized protein (DUF433 family)